MSTLVRVLKAIAEWCRARNAAVPSPTPVGHDGQVLTASSQGPRLPRALKFVSKWEGGYVNHPDDPGGATNFGITQAVYAAYLREQGLRPVSVRHIGAKHVEEIYRTRYWDKCRCGELPAPVDLVVFDTAVNCGTRRAARWLQEACSETVDGVVGPKTLEAVMKEDHSRTARGVCNLREAHYLRLARSPRFEVFLKGWMNRLRDLKRTAGL